MNIITVVLLVVALVLFVLCTLGTPSPPRFNLLAAGLAFMVLAILGSTVHAETPQSREDARREHRAYEREQHYDLRDQRPYKQEERMQRDHLINRLAWCHEQRDRVRRHPRLILPRVCRRDRH